MKIQEIDALKEELAELKKWRIAVTPLLVVIITSLHSVTHPVKKLTQLSNLNPTSTSTATATSTTDVDVLLEIGNTHQQLGTICLCTTILNKFLSTKCSRLGVS